MRATLKRVGQVSPPNDCYESYDPREPVLFGGSRTPQFEIEFEPQSMEQNVIPSFDKVSITSFLDQNPAAEYKVPSGTDSTFAMADVGDAELSDFFSRPIRVATYSYDNTVFFQNFNPWNLFFSNPRIANRITNFNLLRCTLHIKFMINGTPFHSGRLMASYNPFYSVSDVDNALRGLIFEDCIRASQRPHVFINPTTSQGGTISIPFFSYKNAIHIPTAGWNEMGVVDIQQLAPLQTAGGAFEPMPVSVFVWATDVVLSTPTVTDSSSLSPQADEYGVGPISKPASAVARAAGALTDIPAIGKYARATEIGANAISKVASAYGYCAPVIVEPNTKIQYNSNGNMAVTNVDDTSAKLSVDVKQELTIDPAVAGLGNSDQMSIVDVAKRESIYSRFLWQDSNGPDAQLFATRVKPTIFNSNTNPGTFNREYHFLPCGLVSLPFEYWRGSMEFRFQVMASAFHKGRLRISYEPTPSPSNPEFNTNYTWIMDIAETKDLTVKVGWGQDRAFLKTYDEQIPIIDAPFTAGLVFTTTDICSNGVLTVQVLNPLRIPNANLVGECLVLVSAKMCDDFEVAAPTGSFIERMQWVPNRVPPPSLLEPDEPVKIENLKPQSQDATVDSEMVVKPVSELASPLNDTTLPVDDGTMLVFFGESVKSIRTLLKRYCFHSLFHTNWPGAVGALYYSRIAHNFPYHKGPIANAIHNNTLGTNNYCGMTLLNWFTPSYVAWRGSIRHKFLFGSRTGANSPGSLAMVSRDNSHYTGYNVTVRSETTSMQAISVSRLAEYAALFHRTDSPGGCHTQCMGPGGALEVELPFQTSNRWDRARARDYTGPIAPQQGQRTHQYHKFTTAVFPTGGTNIQEVYYDFVAAGEDYNLLFFIGVPIMYVEAFTIPV